MSDLADAYREQRNVWMRRARWRLAERDAAVARAEVAEAALARVEALHQPWAHAELSEVCETCSDSAEWEAWQAGEGYRIKRLTRWPCPTVRALSGDTPTEPNGDESRPDDRARWAHECPGCAVDSAAPHEHPGPLDPEPAAPTQDGDDR